MRSATCKLIMPLASPANWVAASILAESVRAIESAVMVILPGFLPGDSSSPALSKLVASIVPPLAMIKLPAVTNTSPPLPS